MVNKVWGKQGPSVFKLKLSKLQSSGRRSFSDTLALFQMEHLMWTCRLITLTCKYPQSSQDCMVSHVFYDSEGCPQTYILIVTTRCPYVAFGRDHT